MRRGALLAAALLLGAACSSDDPSAGGPDGAAGGDAATNGDGAQVGDAGTDDRCAGTEVDTYVAGLDKKSDNGAFTVRLVEARPAPPRRQKDNAWTLQLLDSAGTVIDDAAITATPTMPTHGHGTTPPNPVATATGSGGKYTLEPLNLFMPGPWKVALSIEVPGGDKDEVAFWFCIAA